VLALAHLTVTVKIRCVCGCAFGKERYLDYMNHKRSSRSCSLFIIWVVFIYEKMNSNHLHCYSLWDFILSWDLIQLYTCRITHLQKKKNT